MKKDDFVKLGIDEETAKTLETASLEELKGYIPKARFDEVNNEKKTLERSLQDMKSLEPVLNFLPNFNPFLLLKEDINLLRQGKKNKDNNT